MWRSIHSWTGLVAALLVVIMALTGTVLSTQPLYNAYQYAGAGSHASVADVIERIATANPRIEPQRLSILPSGEATLSYSRNHRLRKRNVALDTGKFLPKQREPKAYEFTRKLHRSFLLGENGRLIPAVGGMMMLLLCLSGGLLLLHRLGGWRHLFAIVKWRGITNTHAALGRVAVLPLLLTALTALWLSAVTFDLVSTGSDKPPAYPESLQKRSPVPPWQLHGLQEIRMDGVKEIVYPIPEDWFDVWTVRTGNEYIFIDRFTGDVLSRETLPVLARIMDWVMLLHTGQGAIVWAVVLLFSSLSVAFFAVSGIVIWWRNRRQQGGHIRAQSSVNKATTLIIVGSESGTTWQFAKALHVALCAASESVRTIEMNALGKHYPKLQRIVALTATYGDGDAPKSATRFMSRLPQMHQTQVAHTTLAFGDKAFPAYCAFGQAVDAALTAKFGQALLPLTTVDKRSAQTFMHWCQQLATVLEMPLDVQYVPQRPKTYTLTLDKQQLFGQSLGTTVAVLRFKAASLPDYQPGDLVAVYPPECAVPRLYSIGSDARRDGYLEICVRLQERGVCSSFLCALTVGETIEVMIERNERFHLPSRRPVIMVGAGTGIAPFTGMIRANAARRPFALYWGGRHPEADALYAREIADWLAHGYLQRYMPAWSRLEPCEYVQDKIRTDKAYLEEQLRSGAVVMVCGGQAMADAVRQEIVQIAHALGTSIGELKRRNRYLEDVY